MGAIFSNQQKPFDILVVDDTAEYLQLVVELLKGGNYDVRTAISGELALESIKAKHPDLLLLDVKMPGMDGYELCRQLKADDNTRDIPVIFISAINDEPSKVIGFQVGGVDYINKPFRREEVLVRVKTHLGLHLLQRELKEKNQNLETEIQKRIEIEKKLTESEKRFKLLYENAPLSYQSLDTKACLIDVNKAWLETLGYTHEEVIGKPFGNFMTPRSAELIKTRFPHFVATGEIHDYVFDMVRKDGSIITVSYEGKIGCDELGNFKQTHCIFANITARKQMEDALREREEKFRGLFEHATIGFSMTQPGGEISINPAFANMLGYEPEELKKMNWKEITHPDDIQESADVVNLLLSGKQSQYRYEKRYIHKNGKIVWADVSTTLLCDEKGEPLYFITNINNITQRKETEEKLKKSETRFRKLIENGNDMITLLDGNGHMIYSSPSAETILGNKVETLMGNYFTELVHPDDQLTLANLFAKLMQSSEHLHFEPMRVLHSNGNWHWIEGTANNLLADPDVNAIVVNYRDITDRQKTEQTLLESERRYRSLFEQASDGIFITDPNGNYVDVNNYGCEMLGYTRDEILKLNIKDLIRKSELEKNPIRYKELSEKPVVTTERMLIHKNGTLIPVEITGKTLDDGRIQGIVRDITQRKITEEKLLRSERELKKAQQITHIGSWYLNTDTNEVVWTEELYRMYGFDPNLPVPPYTEHKKLFTPESWDLLSASLAKTAETGIPYELELKTVKKEGGNGWMWVRGETIKDENGKSIGLWGAAQDISDRKKIEEDIKKERTLMRTLIDNLPNTVYVKDLEGRKMIANKADIDFIGKTFKEVIKKTDLEIFEGEIGQHGFDDDMRVMQTGEAMLNVEEHFIDNQGEKRWLVTSKIPLRDSAGKVYGLVGTGRDVTKQHRDHETIQKLTMSIEQSPSSIVITNLKGDIEYVNPKFTEITGFTPDEVIGKNPRILKSGEMPAERYKELWDTISSGGVWRGEFHNRKKNGELYWEWATITSIKDDRGEIINYIAIKEDISLRKQMETDLLNAKGKAEESEAKIKIQNQHILLNNERLESLLKISQFQTDSVQELLDFALKEAVDLTKSTIGYIYFYIEEKKQFILNTWSKEVMKECAVINPQTVYDLDKTGCWGEAVRQRKPIIINDFKSENPIKKGTPEGHVQLEKFLIIPVIFDNKIVAVAGVANKSTDYDSSDVRQLTILMDSVWKMSERLILIKDLHASKEKAEENDRLKSAFLANMSHEIRTPLNSILGFSELMSDPDVERSELSEYSRLIAQSGNNLLMVINDILDISKIESGQVQIKNKLFSATQLVKDLLIEFEMKTLQKGVLLRVDGGLSDQECMVLSDETRVKQVLTNFLTNALKFTEKGCIEIGLATQDDNVLFSVKDTGIGIPCDYHHAIFTRFRQIETAHTRKYGGNGLGLAIAKSLVELLDGEIGVESEPGKGSCFYFSIPIVAGK